MRTRTLAFLAALAALASPAHALDTVRIELNTLETIDNRCRMTFVIENPGAQMIDSLKLDLALFNPESAVYRRMVTEMGPVRGSKTVVKTFATDGDCTLLAAVLVNEVTACAPGEPNACLDALALSSRVKPVRLYK